MSFTIKCLQLVTGIYTGEYIPAGCRFSNRLLAAGKESGGLSSVEDKQVQGPMFSHQTFSTRGAMRCERDERASRAREMTEGDADCVRDFS